MSEVERKNSPQPSSASIDEKKEAGEVGVTVQEVSNILVAEGDYTEGEYKTLVRKIDRTLLPLMWVCYGIQQSDKTSLSTQALFGMREDTGLVGNQFSWLTTIFYLLYMVSEAPFNFLLQRYHLGKTLATFMFLWGIVVGSVSACQNWTQLMIVRGLQGSLESTISPGFMLVIGSWYQSREHSSRSLVFQSANAGYGIFVDLVMYGIAHAAMRTQKFAAWRAIGIFLGGSTVIVAVVCYFILGTPSEVSWLTDEEKKMANARIIRNKTGTDQATRVWKWDQVKDAFTDPTTLFFFMNAFLSSVPNGGLTTFSGVLNRSFGFTELEVILYTIPRSIVSVLWFTFIGLTTSKYPNTRMYFMGFSVIPPFIGLLALGLLPSDPSVRWIKWGMYLMSVTSAAAFFLSMSLVPSNVAGRTKKTVVSSTLFIGYCVGNMVGSQVFRAKDAPTYSPGVVACSICFALQFLTIVAWRFWYAYSNRKRDRVAAAAGITEEEMERVGKLMGEEDKTDRENPHFRYTM